MTALDSGNVFRDLLALMYGWARTIQQRDGIGHIFGLRLTLNANDLTSTIQRLLQLHPSGHHAGATAAPRRVVRTPPAAAGAPTLTPAPTPVATPAPASTVQSTTAGVGASLQSTTKQLSGLLSYLLGGGR
jgi:hypothetical protein